MASVNAGAPQKRAHRKRGVHRKRGAPRRYGPPVDAWRSVKAGAPCLCALEGSCEPVPYILSWQVRAITSSCCSRVRSMNFTAYPETRMVKLAYSGFSG